MTETILAVALTLGLVALFLAPDNALTNLVMLCIAFGLPLVGLLFLFGG